MEVNVNEIRDNLVEDHLNLPQVAFDVVTDRLDGEGITGGWLEVGSTLPVVNDIRARKGLFVFHRTSQYH